MCAMVGELGVPERSHVREVLVEAARAGERLRTRPGVVRTESIGGGDVVVLHGAVRRHRVGRHAERDEGGGRVGVGADGATGRVGHAHAAVDGDVRIAGQHHPIGELRDRHRGALVAKGGDLRRQVAVGVGPGGALSVVDAEALVLEQSIRAVLDQEGAPEAGDDALVVAEPPDGRGRAVGPGPCVGIHVEGTAVARLRSASDRRGGGGDENRFRRVRRSHRDESSHRKASQRQATHDEAHRPRDAHEGCFRCRRHTIAPTARTVRSGYGRKTTLMACELCRSIAVAMASR